MHYKGFLITKNKLNEKEMSRILDKYYYENKDNKSGFSWDWWIVGGRYSEEGLKLFNKINEIIDRNEELEENNKKYIIQLTDEQYRKLVDNIRRDVYKEWETLIKEKIEELKDKANRIAGTYQYADSDEALENKKEKVVELRLKAEGLEELLGEEK